MSEELLDPEIQGALVERLARDPSLIFLDVDGTLAPIAPTPEEAIVPPETTDAVARLAAAPDTSVILVSGRAAADARRMVPVTGLWVIGNHGMELLSPEGDLTADERAAGFEPQIRAAAERARAAVAKVPGMFVEDKRWTLSVHHRLVSDGDAATATAELHRIAKSLGLRVTHGKQVVEIRPPVEIHKGTALVSLARRLAGEQLDAALFYAGDDHTDEDAFVELRAAAPWAVTVRGPPGAADSGESSAATFAEFNVRSVAALKSVLDRMADLRSGDSG